MLQHSQLLQTNLQILVPVTVPMQARTPVARTLVLRVGRRVQQRPTKPAVMLSRGMRIASKQGGSVLRLIGH